MRYVRSAGPASAPGLGTGRVAVRGEGSARTHLDPHHDALFLKDVSEQLALAVLLVEGLMEQDHAPDALADRVVHGEEDFSELPSVLFRVLHVDPLQAVSHGAYGRAGKGSIRSKPGFLPHGLSDPHREGQQDSSPSSELQNSCLCFVSLGCRSGRGWAGHV